MTRGSRYRPYRRSKVIHLRTPLTTKSAVIASSRLTVSGRAKCESRRMSFNQKLVSTSLAIFAQTCFSGCAANGTTRRLCLRNDALSSSLRAFMNFARRHLVCGWCFLHLYLFVGLLLEALHGFKFGWYLDVDNEMRRLMLTLGHAHGTLFALVNIAAGADAAEPRWFHDPAFRVG